MKKSREKFPRKFLKSITMGIFDSAKMAADVLKEAGKIEEYRQILELLDKLLELQKRSSDLEIENKILMEKLDIKEKLEYRNNSYWMGSDGPFCSRCWEKNKDLMRMHHGEGDNYAHCPECKSGVNFTGRETAFPENNTEW